MNNYSNIVLLIDADNTPCDKLEAILADYGSIAVKRAYGNWSKPCLKNWAWPLQHFGIRAVQQFDCASGKNATDIALTVDAMDLLHTGRYDTFILVASDSDYVPLALRLRESGAKVICIGKRGAPAAYVNVCDEFRTLDSFAMPATIDTSFLYDEDDAGDFGFASEEEILAMDIDDFPTLKIAPETEADHPSRDDSEIWDTIETADDEEFSFPSDFSLEENADRSLQDLFSDDEGDECEEIVWDTLEDDLLPPLISEDAPEMRSVHKLLEVAYQHCKGEDGFARLSAIGNFIRDIRPDFDYHDYGYCQLHELLQAYPEKYQLITYPRHTHAKVMAFRCCA